MADNNAGNWIRLNVGGKVFHTTKHTLRKYPGSFLATLCDVEGIQPSEKDESGAFLIDRDPEHFRLILNFLRNDSLDADANLPYDGLVKEAEFYGLTELAAQIDDARKEEKTCQGTQWITMVYAPGGLMDFVFAGDAVDENRLLIAELVDGVRRRNRATTNGEISLDVGTCSFPLVSAKVITILRAKGFKLDLKSDCHWSSSSDLRPMRQFIF